MRRGAVSITLALICAAALSGCAITDALSSVRNFLHSDTRVIVTMGNTPEELFRVEDLTCSPQEYLVTLINMQKIYESGFSAELFAGAEGEALAKSLKENALARISRIKVLVLLAARNEISLTEEEMMRAHDAAEAYDLSLTDADRAAMGGVTIETLQLMLEEYILSDKIYRYLIRDINPEVSDDEARRVTVRQIVLRTWEAGNGDEHIPLSAEDLRRVNVKAGQILRDLESGTEFEDLMARYNEADESEFTFGRGERDPVLEEEAFALSVDEVSDSFDTDDGVTIIKLIATSDRAEIDSNKLRIMEERRSEVFESEYNLFAQSLARTLNEDMYEQITLTDDPAVTTHNFFTICSDACPDS